MDNMKYLILGASSDVGMEYIGHLIDLGVEVEIIGQYRTMSKRLEELQKRALASDIKLVMIKADLTCTSDINELIESIDREIGSPDRILFLPASKLHYRKLKDADWESVQEDFNIQVIAAGRLLGYFLPKMAKNKYGRAILMLSSVVCNNPPKYMTEYAIVKNALWGLVKGAAVEYCNKNVFVSGLSPRMMETKFLSEVDEKIVALNAHSNSNGSNYSIHELIPFIDKVFDEESDIYNGINIYPEN